MISVAANRYARALVEVVLEPGSDLDPKAVAAQLSAVADLIRESGELRHVLASPAVTHSRKRAVIARLAPALTLSPKVRNFFFVLIDHGRIAQLPQIREAYEVILDEKLGFVRADVTSAQALSDAERSALQAKLGNMTGKKIRMEYAIDPDLVGGVVARIGSTVYDGSVRGQLNALRKRLATEA